MPVYEYACYDCRKIVSILHRTMESTTNPACPDCTGSKLKRRISRVVIAKGGRGVLGDVDTSRMMSNYGGHDKRSQAQWARQVAGELGGAGEDFREMAEKVEAGEDVWDLYDPGPMLEHKVNQKADEEAGANSDTTSDFDFD